MALLLPAVGVACAQDTHSASWPNLVIARQQDAIDRGWVPEFLPEETYDIRQLNRPTTEEAAVTGTLAVDIELPECTGAGDTTLPDLDAPWFPDEMAGEVVTCPDGWLLHRNGATLYLWRLADDDEEATA